MADAAKAMPAVVNVYTSKEMRQRNPVLDDPLLRRYFPDFAERLPRQRRLLQRNNPTRPYDGGACLLPTPINNCTLCRSTGAASLP